MTQSCSLSETLGKPIVWISDGQEAFLAEQRVGASLDDAISDFVTGYTFPDDDNRDIMDLRAELRRDVEAHTIARFDPALPIADQFDD